MYNYTVASHLKEMKRSAKKISCLEKKQLDRISKDSDKLMQSLSQPKFKQNRIMNPELRTIIHRYRYKGGNGDAKEDFSSIKVPETMLNQYETDKKNPALPQLYYGNNTKSFLENMIISKRNRKQTKSIEKDELTKIGHAELKSLSRISKISPDELHRNNDILHYFKK